MSRHRPKVLQTHGLVGRSCVSSKKQVKSEIADVASEDRGGHDDVVRSPGKPTQLSQDKGKHNKFQYRYKTAPQEVKDAWSQLQKERNPEEMQKFMEEAVQTMVKYTSSFLTKCKTTKFEEMEGEEGGWISWSKAAEEEGRSDIFLEMFNAKTSRDSTERKNYHRHRRFHFLGINKSDS